MVEAHFCGAEQEDFGAQAVGAAGDGFAGAGALAVGNLYLLDHSLDLRVEQPQECAIQIAVNGAVFVIIYVGAVPLAVFINVFHQKPGAVAALIVHRARFALMDDQKLFWSTIYIQLYDTANRHGTQSSRCH